MMSVSTLIDFLMNLLRDEDARAAFEQDPQGELTRNGLDCVSAQDVRDARLIMADDGGVRPRSEGGSSSNHSDPVREIHHTTNNYEINQGHTVGDIDIDQTLNVINIDDRDTVVVDSFNSADTNDIDVVAIQDNSTDIDIEDSFNENGPGSEPAPADEGPAGEVSTDPVDEPAAEDEPAEPETGIDPVEHAPGDGGFGAEPEVGIDPVESEPVDEPELETAIV